METESLSERLIREHEERLTVGATVRINLGECPGLYKWHGAQEQGVTGTVLAVDADKTLRQVPPDHRYVVMFDRPLRAKGLTGDYCAAELVPITHEEIMAEILARVAPDDRQRGGEDGG